MKQIFGRKRKTKKALILDLLQLAVKDFLFIFNGKYKIDGVAMVKEILEVRP